MSEAQHNGFYKPLAKTGEIRLLYLETLEDCGPDGYKLWCSVKHINLSDKVSNDSELNERVRYEALSYEWGSEENPQHLWIRDHPTPVLIRENLYIALVALLLPDAWRPLWVDAICINQENVEERNSQVTQMATIYSSADLVVVWLGREASDSSRAMKLLAQAADAPNSQRDHALRHESFDLIDFSRLITKANYRSVIALEALCLRTYWNRLWIIQEVSRARTVVLQCGFDVVPWKIFGSMCNIIEIALDGGLTSIQAWPTRVSSALRNIRESRAAQLVSLRKQLQRLNAIDSKSSDKDRAWLETHDILALFEKNADAECQYPHDMVFGLLSLTMRCCQDLVPVDYDMPISELCYKVLEHDIVQHSGVEFPELLLKRSELLHQRLKVLPRIFSAPTSSTTLVSSSLPHCTSQTYIRFVSDHSKSSYHAWAAASVHAADHRGWLNFKINAETDLVCSIPRAFSRSEEDMKIPSPDYDSSLEQRANGRILPPYQVRQIKESLARNLRMDMQSGHLSKLPSFYIEADDEGQIYGYLALLLHMAREKERWPVPTPYKVAVDDEGVLYFVPLDTQTGDIIYRIDSEERLALALLRETSDGKMFVAGQAIYFFTGLSIEARRGSENPQIAETLSFAVQLSMWKMCKDRWLPLFSLGAYAAQPLAKRKPSFFESALERGVKMRQKVSA